MPCPLAIQRGSFFAWCGGGTHTVDGGRGFGGFGMQRAMKRLRRLSTSPLGLDRTRQISTENGDSDVAGMLAFDLDVIFGSAGFAGNVQFVGDDVVSATEDACLARVDEQSVASRLRSARRTWQTLAAVTKCSVRILKRTLNMARVFPFFVEECQRARPSSSRWHSAGMTSADDAEPMDLSCERGASGSWSWCWQ